MDLAQGIKKRISINDSWRLSMRSLIITLLSGFLAYHLLVIHEFTNPDGICEGLTFYTNGDWALAGCGRWAIRYMNEMTCNIVMPLFVVVMYCVCIWLSIVLLSKLWKFSDSAVVVLSIILIATPAVAEQLTYTYTALAYAYSCLLSVLFVYLVFRCNWKAGMIGGTLCVTVMLGLYQSYVGMVAALVFMTIILELLESKKIKPILISFVVCAASALLGCFFYSKILEWDMTRRGLDNSGTRVSQFNLTEIFEKLSESVEYVYFKYFTILRNDFMHRNVLYWIIVILLVGCLLVNILKLMQTKMYGRTLSIIVLIILIPLASNLIGVLVPYNGLDTYMQYQTIMIVPFMLACVWKCKDYNFGGMVQAGATLLVFVLAWTFIIASNATYRCYELSYKHINSQMQIAVTRVYDLNDYIMDETPILIAGFPDDATLRNNMDIYQYAENFYTNPAFWIGMHGATQNRYLYFLNYFGIDAQRFSDDEYAAIINTPQFAEMPVWPEKGSVAMIDGFAVVKFTEEPPMP